MIADVHPDDFKKIRHNSQMTQPEMAEALGVTLSSVKKYEAGIAIPSIEVLTRMSEYFHIDFKISATEKHPLIEKKEGAGTK